MSFDKDNEFVEVKAVNDISREVRLGYNFLIAVDSEAAS